MGYTWITPGAVTFETQSSTLVIEKQNFFLFLPKIIFLSLYQLGEQNPPVSSKSNFIQHPTTTFGSGVNFYHNNNNIIIIILLSILLLLIHYIFFFF
jgi:hypothetical protein